VLALKSILKVLDWNSMKRISPRQAVDSKKALESHELLLFGCAMSVVLFVLLDFNACFKYQFTVLALWSQQLKRSP